MLLGNGGRSNLGIESLITASISPLFTVVLMSLQRLRGKCIHPARRCFALHEAEPSGIKSSPGFSDWAMIASERLFLLLLRSGGG